MATLMDIAKVCGTSTATVSYVLNGKGEEKRISKETQELIIAEAKRLNYPTAVLSEQVTTVPTFKQYKIVIYCPTTINFEPMIIPFMRIIKEYSLNTYNSPLITMQFYNIGRLKESFPLDLSMVCDAAIIWGSSREDIDYITKM